MKEEIVQLRDELNDILSVKHIDWDKALKISKELDLLIIEYYQKQYLPNIIHNS